MGSIVDILLYNVVAFLAVLTVIVAVHEAGHFFMARLCRVRVLTFSIGFGPELFGWTGRQGTRYKISALPLGGYVRMAGGLMPDTPEAQEEGAFPSRPIWQRALVIFAGPLANFIFAFAILFVMAMTFGSAKLPPKIGGFTDNSAAAETALGVGDVIVSVNGRDTESFGDIARIMALHTGGPMDIEARRPDGGLFSVVVDPNEDSMETATGPVRVFRLGIRATDEVETQTYGVIGAVGAALQNQVEITSMVFQGLGQVITGRRPVTELEGPVGMSQHVAEASQSGIWTVLQMMIFLNMIIGLMNLLPIPVLDGGHLMMFGVEAIMRRPLSLRVQERIHQLGTAIMLFIIALVMFNDLNQMVFHHIVELFQ